MYEPDYWKMFNAKVILPDCRISKIPRTFKTFKEDGRWYYTCI